MKRRTVLELLASLPFVGLPTGTTQEGVLHFPSYGGAPAATMEIECQADTVALQDAIQEMCSLVKAIGKDRLPQPITNLLDGLVDGTVNLFDDLWSIHLHPAHDTRKMLVTFQPTDRFLDFISTLRALDANLNRSVGRHD